MSKPKKLFLAVVLVVTAPMYSPLLLESQERRGYNWLRTTSPPCGFGDRYVIQQPVNDDGEFAAGNEVISALVPTREERQNDDLLVVTASVPCVDGRLDGSGKVRFLRNAVQRLEYTVGEAVGVVYRNGYLTASFDLSEVETHLRRCEAATRVLDVVVPDRYALWSAELTDSLAAHTGAEFNRACPLQAVSGRLTVWNFGHTSAYRSRGAEAGWESARRIVAFSPPGPATVRIESEKAWRRAANGVASLLPDDTGPPLSLPTGSHREPSTEDFVRLGEAYDEYRHRWFVDHGGVMGNEEISARQGMAIIRQLHEQLGIKIPGHKASTAASDWSSNTELARVTNDGALMLPSRNLTPDTVRVIAILTAGEVLEVVDRASQAFLENPMGRGPSSNGDWLKVRTLDGLVGWVLAGPWEGTPLLSMIVRPHPIQTQAPSSSSDSVSAMVIIGLLGLGAIVALISALGGGGATSASAARTDTAYGHDRSFASPSNSMSGDSEESSSWFDEAFAGRKATDIRAGFLESDGELKGRRHLEAHEGMYREFVGEEPKQRAFESNSEYHRRIAQEAREAMLERAQGERPGQRFLESDDDYRDRLVQESNEAIVEAATGQAPKQGFFEFDDTYQQRITNDANESIIEAATGEAPKMGFFETEDSYRERIRNEANEIRGSSDSDSESSGCFLTTAAVHSAGLPDDCWELTTLRTFRDQHIVLTAAGQFLIREYYTVAPEIVRRIDASRDRDHVWDAVYKKLRTIAAMIDGERHEDAMAAYSAMFNELRDKTAL